MLPLLNLVQAETPWWKLLLSDIPHDAGAVVVYLLIGGMVFLIWRANRKKAQ